MRARRGVTLIELLVVLVLLGFLYAISGLALASLGTAQPSERLRALETARTTALRTGVAVAVTDSGRAILFLPDGRALGAGVDPLTGALHAP